MAAGKRAQAKTTSLTAAGPRRLPLSSLRVFVVAAEHLSFSRAAVVLGVTAGAVSMQIRTLEHYLRAPLFRRRSGAMQLTAVGERLLPRVRTGLEELERAIDEARSDRRSGPLMLSMLASFLQQWLLPRLPDFYQRHPAIDLRIHTSSHLVDFARAEVHAAIRFGLGTWPRLHAEKLLDEWLVPVCTRKLLDKNGAVATREDLQRYRLLHSTSEPWRAWYEGPTTEEEWAPAGSTFDDSVVVLRAAEAGHGLALARWSLVAREIKTGRLVVASPRIVPTLRAYYFVCPSGHLEMEKVAALREWLRAQAREMPSP